MFSVLRIMYGKKASMSNPDAFKDKIKQYETMKRREKKNSKTETGGGSLNRSMTSGFSDNKSAVSRGEENADCDSEGYNSDGAKWFENDPVYVELDDFF